ncbi:MAG TPA: hypothetical protein VFJ77_00940 [Gaiellaceae bacterium]|nr:hypothetical protein [Gaiellaceae bacterium]
MQSQREREADMSERFDTFGPPPPGYGGEPDWDAEAGAPDEPSELDPRDAAALLARTASRAERAFDLRPTFLFFAAAATVLVAYGAVWLSVRNQHPYSGPSGTALGVLYGVVAAWALLNVVVLRRALAGRSSPRRPLEALTFAAIWICVYVFQEALHHADPSHAIAYGVWAAAAPLLVVGAAAAGYEAARGRRTSAGLAVAVVVLAAIGSFAGPADVWGVIAVGFCGLLVLGGAAQLWQRRAAA